MRHRKAALRPEHIRAGSLLLNCVISGPLQKIWETEMDQPAGKEGPDLSWRGKGIVCGVTTKKDPVIEQVRLVDFPNQRFNLIQFHFIQ